MEKLVRLVAIGALILGAWMPGDLKAQTNSDSTYLRYDYDILLHRKGDSKEKKVTIIMEGDSVTVNGMPAELFKDSGLIVMRRTIVQGKAVSVDILVDGDGIKQKLKSINVPDLAIAGRNRYMLGVVLSNDSLGARITAVVPGSPAEKADLFKEDVIQLINDSTIKDANDAYKLLAKNQDSMIVVRYTRDGKTIKKDVKLTKLPIANMRFNDMAPSGLTTKRNVSVASPVDISSFQMFQESPKLGLSIQETESGKGLKVLEVEKGSIAEKAGLREDDIILEYNGRPVNNVSLMALLSRSLSPNSSATLKVLRKGKEMTLTLIAVKQLKKMSM